MIRLSEETLIGPNGYPILDDKDLYQVLEENVSRDIAEFVVDRIQEVDTDLEYAENLAQTDARGYEETNERYHGVMSDAVELLSELIGELSYVKRWNKSKILVKLAEIEESLSQEL